MFSLKRCFLGIGLAVGSCVIAVATPPLTTVQDVLYKADGSKFNGIATISWQSFEAVDSSTIPPQTITVQIVDGFVRVQLVPTTNAVTPASYTVVYDSDGRAQFTESWIVPPSNVPVRVREVRVGGPGSVIGGGVVAPAPLTVIQISDVLGLTAALNIRPAIGTGYTPSRAAVINATGAVDGASGNLSDCLHVDGGSAACGTSANSAAGFVDGEIPAGAIDGVNTAFTLVSAPNPPASLTLFRSGLLLRPGTDYTLTNANISFASQRPPLLGDVLVSSYRVAVNISGVAFVDGEIPSGAVDGTNVAFLLARTPAPVASLALYRNGLRLRMNLDYTISGNGIIFQPGLAPLPGDILQCSYRTSTGP
jgi:hypothetical protein